MATNRSAMPASEIATSSAVCRDVNPRTVI
jgi:hypothetical protein